MLEQSDAVKQAWQASDRTLDIVINVDGTDYQATSVNSLSYDAGAFTGDSLGIGSTYENSISVEFASVIEAFAAGQVVKPQIGIKVNGAFEYTPLGVFIISEVNRDRNNNLTTIKALDQMVKLERAYTSTLTYPAAMLDVVAEIASQGGVTVNQTDLAHLPNLPKLNSAITGQTLRTAIGWIAQFYAGFAAFDRSGQLTIRTTAKPDYVINPSEYMQGGLTKNEVTYQTGGIKVSVTTTSATETGEQEDKTTTLQAGETSGSQIELTNNVMTNDALSTIWTSIKDVSFYPYSLNWFGNPALEAGDWVTLTDTQGNKFNVPVNQLTFTFNGGLESTISANQASQSSTVIPWTGPTQNAINQAITRKTATGNNVYDPSFTEEPKNAKIGDVWFKQNGNNVELWTYSRDSSGNASWQKQEVDGEVKAQVEKAIDEAKKLAIEAQTTADGKNSVYRGSDPNTVPTAGLKEGDLYFTDNTLYTWTGTSWEETISDTTGAEIKAKVDEAIAEAKSAAETADAKNKVYRVKDVSVIPTANLKTGDICFTDNAVYTWTGSAWEETVSDTTGAEIKAKVDQVAQENQKAVADLTSNVESKAKDLDTSIQSTRSDLTAANNAVAKDLSTTKSDLANVSKDLSETKGNMQSGLDAVNKDLSTAKSDLANVSKDLSDTKSNLGTVSNDLSETKNNLATVTDDLSKTKSNLADTGQKIETAVSDFQKKTDQLSGSLETANSKIEFNSNAISEVKQTADQISTTVSNMKVGGRNLVLGTQAAKTIFDGTVNANISDRTVESDYSWPDLQSVVLKEHLSNLGLTYNDTLTVTGNLTISKNGTLTKSDFADTFGVALFRTTHNWNTHAALSKNDLVDGQTTYNVKETFVIGDSGQFTGNLGWSSSGPYFWLNMAPTGYSIIVNHYKVEKGNVATDWTPAPEDTDQAISKVSQTADTIRADLTNTQGDVASVKATANSLQTQITDNKNNISSVKQTADSLTTRMSNAEGNVSSLQQTASGLETTVGQMPAQWQQAINDKANAQVLSSGVDMNTLTTAGAYLVKDSNVNNAPIAAWFMAVVEATADGARVVQRVKKDDSNVAYERSNTNTGWTAWERVATGSDISSIQQTINGITTRVGDAEGNVSTLQQTSKDLTTRVGNAEGNISQLQQTADGLSATVKGGRNQLNNTSSTLQNVTVDSWCYYSSSTDEPIAKHQLDGQKVTLSVWIENPSKEAWVQLYTDKGILRGNSIPAGGKGWSQVTDIMPSGFSGWNIVVGCGDGSGTVTFSYSSLQLELGPNRTAWSQSTADITQLKITANSLSSDIANAKGDISQLQQTANGLTTRVGDAEGNISTLQQTAKGLESTVGQMPAQWQQAINDKTNAQVLSYDVDMNTLTTAGTYLIEDSNVKNAPISAWFMASVEATADGARVLQRVKKDDSNVAYERSNASGGWTPWERVATGSDISSIQQTINGITTRVGDAEGNVSTLQQTSKDLTTRVGNAEGNISQLQQTANGLTSTISGMNVGGRNLLDGETGKEYSATGTTSFQDVVDFGMLVPADQEHYVLSFDAKATTAGQQISTFFYCQDDYSKNCTVSAITSSGYNGPVEVDGRVTTALTTDYKRYWIKYTINPANKVYLNAIIARIEANSGTATVSVKNAKLETGTMPTDWTPSPESIDSSISQIKQNTDGIAAYVKASKGSDTLASLLSMDPNNSTIAQVVNGKPIAAINLSSEGDVTIDGKRLHITASTTIDDASIGSAKIASLSADKITAGTLDASVVTVKNINADNISTGTLAAEHLHVTKDTVIDNGTIGNAQISNLSADKITAGTLDASQIRVINLDANSITTGSLSAAVIKASGFENYTVSPSNTWDFDKIKSTYGNWFLIGETTADHVYNGPKDASNNKLTPFMYVTSRGNPDGNRFTITVWKDDDPTQYQRTWDGNHWSDWVILPNSQNIVSAINLSPDSVMIAGKKITLDGDVTIVGTAFANKLKATGITVDQLVAGNIDASKINVINLNANNITAGTISGNNLSINLDNGQVAFTKGSLHSTDGMFNIDLDNKSFKIQTNNGIGLYVDDNGFHYKANSTSDLWINKDGFHSYTDGNPNGTWIKDDSFTNSDAIGQGVTIKNGNIQFSSLPYWSSDNSKVYGSIYRDPGVSSSNANGLMIEGTDGLTLKTSAAIDSYLGAGSIFGLGDTEHGNGSYLTLSNNTNNPSFLYSNSTVYLTAGDFVGIGSKPTVSIGTDEYFTHSGLLMSSSNGTGRGASISAYASNVNVSATGWINFEASGSDGRIAFQANYIHMYPTYLKTTSAGANVYVAEDGALVRSTSARKYKTDIQPASEFADYGNKLISLTPKVWLDKAEVKRYKDDPEKNKKPGYYYGLIADELDQAGLNKLVTYGADGQVEGIQYDRLAVALLPIIKKLKEDVKELKERILK